MYYINQIPFFDKGTQMAKGGAFILPGDLPQTFTVSDLTEEHQMVRQTVREFVANEINTPEAIKKIESKDWAFSRALLRELGELGVLGAEVPEQYGGQGMDKIMGAIIAEEISKQGSFACTFLADTGIGTLPIRYFGTEEQKKKYLPRLTSGKLVAAYCLTESGAGSDADAVGAVAVKDNNYYVLNGAKIFVTNGGFADIYIVFAQVKDYGLTAFIVEKCWPGVNVIGEEHKIGIRGSSTAIISIDNVTVPEANLLGGLGKGLKIALNILNLGRFKLAAASLGGSRQALDDAVKYSKERIQFGQTISNFGAIRQKLARMAAKIYEMESVVYRTAGHLEEAIGQVDANDSRAVLKAIEEFVVECSLVKVHCSEAMDFIVDENVQIHGGNGFCEEYPAARYYRDSRINRIFEGTSEINRLLAVGMLLKKAAPKKDKEGKLTEPELPLMQVIKQVGAESMTPSMQMESDDTIERLRFNLDNSKKVVLLVAGVAFQKFGPKLKEHQIVLMLLSDCLINIYAMESSLCALAKNRNEFNENLVRLSFSESLFEVEKLVKKLVVVCAEGDEQKTILAMVRRLMKFVPENEEMLCDLVAERLLEQ